MELQKWKRVCSDPPPNQDFKRERRRYMVFDPMFTGYVFRCWYRDGFGCDEVGSMISGATHYRVAGRGEASHQLTRLELESIFASDESATDMPDDNRIS